MSQVLCGTLYASRKQQKQLITGSVYLSDQVIFTTSLRCRVEHAKKHVQMGMCVY